ncbi:hypothetical protein AB0M95_16245 [Sphaerisporangium sp. NPDC051017]
MIGKGKDSQSMGKHDGDKPEDKPVPKPKPNSDGARPDDPGKHEKPGKK